MIANSFPAKDEYRTAINEAIAAVQLREHDRVASLLAIAGEWGIAQKIAAYEADLLLHEEYDSQAEIKIAEDPRELTLVMQGTESKHNPFFQTKALSRALQLVHERHEAQQTMVKNGLVEVLMFCLDRHSNSTDVVHKVVAVVLGLSRKEQEKDGTHYLDMVLMSLLTDAGAWERLANTVHVAIANFHAPTPRVAEEELQMFARRLAAQQIPIACRTIHSAMSTPHTDGILLSKKMLFLRQCFSSLWGDASMSESNLCSFLFL